MRALYLVAAVSWGISIAAGAEPAPWQPPEKAAEKTAPKASGKTAASGSRKDAAKTSSPKRSRNLLENGDFEAGSGRGPKGWQRPDELTTFWITRPDRPGRCMKIDTDVLVSQFREREDQMAKALAEGKDPPPAPKPLPTRDPKYDTVAGLDGVHFASAEFPLDPARHYLLEVDARVDGAGAPKVWVKAIASVETRAGARDRPVWKKSLNCNGAGKEWQTFRMVFPVGTRLPPTVSRARIELYPFWPPATYWFDDVRLFEITEEEARAFEAQRVGEAEDGRETDPEALAPAGGESKAPAPPGTGGPEHGAPSGTRPRGSGS